jgi:hypothetical protein
VSPGRITRQHRTPSGGGPDVQVRSASRAVSLSSFNQLRGISQGVVLPGGCNLMSREQGVEGVARCNYSDGP